MSTEYEELLKLKYPDVKQLANFKKGDAKFRGFFQLKSFASSLPPPPHPAESTELWRGQVFRRFSARLGGAQK